MNIDACTVERLATDSYVTVNAEGASDTVLVCEHAGCLIPSPWGDLGLAPEQLTSHIGWDIGAGAVTCCLSEMLDAPAILSHYSRLFFDANRDLGLEHLEHGTAIPEISDGIVIPANVGIDARQRQLRKTIAFDPVHEAIDGLLTARRNSGRPVRLLNVHSFTPVFQGVARPWQVGVLWQRDGRLAGPLIKELRSDGKLVVGDNQPYSAQRHHAYVFEEYGERRGNPYVVLELRNNEIDTADKALSMARRIYTAWQKISPDSD